MRDTAVFNLYPTVATLNAGSDARDKDDNVVVLDETLIQAEILRLQTEYDSKQYQRDRATEYPPVTDYLDGIVKGDTAQVDKYIADCQAVKAKYPKGE